jgi:hypothetical protein
MDYDSKQVWKDIEKEYGISKRAYALKINFVTDPFKREIIFRDIGHSYYLASSGLSKPSVILAGGVIEELLRLYLIHKNITPSRNDFNAYIEACINHKLLKRGIFRLSDSVRCFRNLVHLGGEEDKRHTISIATAKGAVSAIFTISNDF